MNSQRLKRMPEVLELTFENLLYDILYWIMELLLAGSGQIRYNPHLNRTDLLFPFRFHWTISMLEKHFISIILLYCSIWIWAGNYAGLTIHGVSEHILKIPTGYNYSRTDSPNDDRCFFR